MPRSTRRPWFLRPWGLFESARDAATPARRGRRSRTADPVRLVLGELERRETTSETLSFLANGLPRIEWAADTTPTVRTTTAPAEEQGTDDDSFPLSMTVNLSTAPAAREEPARQDRRDEPAGSPAVWSGFWSMAGDEADDFAVPSAVPATQGPGSQTPATAEPPSGSGAAAPVSGAAPAVPTAAASASPAPVAPAPATDPGVAAAPMTAGAPMTASAPARLPAPDMASFTSPTFTPAANPFARGAANVWVLDADNAVTVLPGVTQHAFSGWGVDLRAQAIGKTVSSYSWDVNSTDAPDATSVSTTDNRLTFTWGSFTGAARTDTISLTTTFADSTTDTQTFTFVVNATDSPAWTSTPVTSAATWPGTGSIGVLTPDQLQGEATAAAGPVTLGLDSGAVYAGHSLPSYNPDVPALGLVYNSATADSRPVFLVRYTLPDGMAVPAALRATLTLDGTAGTPVYYDTSAANPGDILQFAVQADATALTTGRYSYAVDVGDPSYVGLPETDPFGATITGKVDLVNRADSPLGAGWSVSGVERVWPVSGGPGEGGAIIEYPGGISVFRATSSGIHTINGAGDFTDFTENSDGTYTQTLTDGTVIQFDTAGLQTSVVDRNGNTTSYGYDGSGRLTTITDPHGLSTTLAYDATSGLLTSIIDPAGAETDFGHDAGGNLTAVTDADTAEWDYGYDTAGRLTSVTDPNTHATTVTYGAADRAESVDLPDGSSRGLTPLVTMGLATGTYGTSTNPAPVVLAAAAYAEFDDGRGSPWYTQFDWAGFGSAAQSFAPDGGESLAYLDANGLPWLMADPLARRTRTFFDGPNPTEAVRADDTTTQAPHYNAFAEPLSVIDANLHTTTYTYDDAGNLSTATDAAGVTTSYAYDARGNLVDTITPLAAPDGWAERAVNQTTTGDQTNPVIASNFDGDSVVAWTSADADGRGVYARRVHPDGTPAGAEFAVNTITTGDQYEPAVAVAPDGSFTVAWRGPDWWNDGVYARRFAADGTPLDSAEFQVNTTGYGVQGEAAVGYAADGSSLIIWSDPYNGRIAGQRYAADGSTAGSEFSLSDGPSTDWHIAPRLTVAPDGSFVAGWEETDFTTRWDFVVRTFAADGTPTSNEEVAVSGSNVPAWDVTPGADGSVLATWQTGDSSGFGIYGRVRDADGTWGAAFTVPAVTYADQQYQSAAALAGGGWAVAWSDQTADGDGYGIMARRIAADGTPEGSDFVVNGTTAGGQSMARLAAAPGGFAAAWQSAGQDGDGWGVYTRRYQFTAESRNDYDGRSRLVRSIDPLSHATLYGYDDASNQTSVTDPLGHTSSATFDAMHRPLTQTDALSGETDFTYDAAGNLETLTDPDNNTTTYTLRDGLNRVLTETDPNGHDTTYAYDGNGDLISVTDRDGRVRTFDYDLAGNRVDEVWWDGTDAVSEADYTYDLAGQLLTAADPNSSYAYAYDALGRVTSEDNAGTPGVPHVVLSYGYDDAGNRTRVSDNLGAVVDATYTDTNRPDTLGLTVGSTLGPNVSFSYDAAENLSGITRQEGTTGDTITTAYTYDPAGRLTDITHASSAAGALSEFSYGYDAANRLTTYTGPEGGRAYGYDDTDQLTSVTDTGTSAVLESFSYDANGNRTMSGYSTDTGNRLTSDGTYNYTYDNEGNTTVKSKTGERWEYTYDFRNRLVEAKELTGVGGTVLYDAQYTYDVSDRRIGVLEDADGAGSGAAVQTWTAYDGANAWADFDGSGALTTRYLNGQGMDQRYARVDAAGTVGWYLTDNLGSVRQIAQTNGTVVYAVAYSAFGVIQSETGTGADRFKYTGREWDAATGQYFYRARYYGAGQGRFTSQDPLRFAAGDTDIYRYVSNNALISTDPTGQAWNWRFALRAALIAAGTATVIIATGGAGAVVIAAGAGTAFTIGGAGGGFFEDEGDAAIYGLGVGVTVGTVFRRMRPRPAQMRPMTIEDIVNPSGETWPGIDPSGLTSP